VIEDEESDELESYMQLKKRKRLISYDERKKAILEAIEESLDSGKYFIHMYIISSDCSVDVSAPTAKRFKTVSIKLKGQFDSLSNYTNYLFW